MTGCQNVAMFYIPSSRLPVILSLLHLSLLIAVPAFAQRPETDAKGGAYADRLKDDIRARKMYEKTARATIPARFRQALESHQPGDGDLPATWGEFSTAAGTPFAAL